jgi:ribosomal protein S18 acetylase RimI-like enzyme
MLSLAQRLPDASPHLTDLPYRLCSWALDDPAQIGLWRDARGRLVGWAVLQSPFWVLDYCYDPALRQEGLGAAILEWAAGAAQLVRERPGGRPAWFAEAHAADAARQAELAAAGFRPISDDARDPWAKVLLAHGGPGALRAAPLTAGFALRTLRGAGEAAAYVEAHRAAFRSENMTLPWRERIIKHPAYRPDFDLVVEAPDGRLAAFCVAWLSPPGERGGPTGQIEPLGVHPDFHRRGLGRAILAAAVGRLYAAGARLVLVETDESRDAAFALYSDGGFGPRERVLMFRRDVPDARG